LSLYLGRVDGFIELVDSLIKQLTAQLSLKTVDLALRLSISLKILCALHCLDSRIVLLDLCSVPLLVTEETNYLYIIPDFVLLDIS
jgi:hypothetical protein